MCGGGGGEGDREPSSDKDKQLEKDTWAHEGPEHRTQREEECAMHLPPRLLRIIHALPTPLTLSVHPHSHLVELCSLFLTH